MYKRGEAETHQYQRKSARVSITPMTPAKASEANVIGMTTVNNSATLRTIFLGALLCLFIEATRRGFLSALER